MPITNKDSENTLLFYCTNLDYGSALPYFIRQRVKESRLSLVSEFKKYLDFEAFPSNSYRQATISNKSLVKIILDKAHPESIFCQGSFIPLQERLPHYYILQKGGVECRNVEHLKTQEGLILDLMKRVGKTLIEGKNLVSVSLPVRIFEKRSTLERICDLWGGAPFYLNKGAQEIDPLKRFKSVICFAMAGMYTNLLQLKPFNPILGETFQGEWPDGSKLYLEHISHHPPICRFLVMSNRFVLEGSYQFEAKIKSLSGNVVKGQFLGTNRVRFKDGECVEFVYPVGSISGLMYGNREMNWEGEWTFKDKRNRISCQLEFTKKAGYFESQIEPTDVFTGEIFVKGARMCKVKGSPVRNLTFDGEVAWDLETSDLIKATPVKKTLPSDSSKRSDLMAWLEDDLETAEDNKAMLEQIQRNDKKLRSKVTK